MLLRALRGLRMMLPGRALLLLRVIQPGLFLPLRIALLLFVLTGLSACRESGTSGEASAQESAVPEAEAGAEALESGREEALSDPRAATLNAQCLVMRRLDSEASEGRIYLLNICPEDVGAEHYAINIAPPGEPSVTAFFDTVRSFATAEQARAYAGQHGIYDLYWEESP
jgi:hypothetical protein